VFQALASEELFDSSADLICDFIHETQEVYENEDVIQLLMPRLIALRAKFAELNEDTEKIRGLTRIFTEAGETYRQLIVQHTDTFFPLVEAIVECTSYHDLDVVPITFHFWYRLTQTLGKQNTVHDVFVGAYQAILNIIIQHLHFPGDAVTLTGQEADDFRSFRHVMGDTLKDCCFILGSTLCLTKAYQMIIDAMERGKTTVVSWQEVEAPLFAMRSMGGEIDMREDQLVPKIMDLIPLLPPHPRIRYAAMLVIARYTEWIDMHPEYIQFQLAYLSAGFENPDSEVSAAAAQAMKYLCKDCKRVSKIGMYAQRRLTCSIS
jgi:transportin-3